MDMADLFPMPDLFPGFVRLGRIPGWFTYERGAELDDGLPRTEIFIRGGKFDAIADKSEELKAVLATLKTVYDKHETTALIAMEMLARVLADGPKLFRPTDEQFEAMEHVEIRIPIAQFRAPYPAFVVAIPPDARRRLIERYRLDPNRTPRVCVVRTHAEPGKHVLVAVQISWAGSEVYQIFQDQARNPDIETAITRRIEASERVKRDQPAHVNIEDEHRASIDISRAALNLCLLLTQYGHREAGPVDPHAWDKHRRKKHLRHLACRDFTAVEMKQDITVRAPCPPTANPPGTGTGIEVRPHWRKGHWRCYPGHRAERAAGVQVPLLFVRPCLVRRDRMDGNESETEVVYHG